MNNLQKLYLWITSKPNTASFIAGVLTALFVEHFLLK